MESKQKRKPLYVVGIGASAGGLEALTSFFDSVKPDTEMSFIVVQHLSPNYRSLLAELLASHTSMRIQQAEQGMELESNCIYLNPPRSSITLKNGNFEVTEFVSVSGTLHLPIDTFFHSLGQEYPERSIGIVLSGTGSDGSRGIRSIKENGGKVMVQDETAKFDGMPLSANTTGCVDYVLSPQDMAAKLHAWNPTADVHPVQDKELGTHPFELERFENVLQILKQQTGTDFDFYKKESVVRRVSRRMSLAHISSVESYLQLLYENPIEARALHNDLLIGVTSFFRDPKAFEVIKSRVLPVIFENKRRDKEIRIWVAGCSTGEEAYSIAILVQEYMEEAAISAAVKIFATDLDRESILFASQGTYSIDIEESVSKERLEKYFKRVEHSYQVNSEIRKMVIFAPHNIVKDPPFINTDLITCRNMLIYLQQELQTRVISLFHYALNTNGFLFLGPSESVGKLENLFIPFERKWNVFQHGASKNGIAYPSLNMSMSMRKSPDEHRDKPNWQTPDAPSQKDRIYRVLVEEHMLPAIVVDEKHDIVSLHGDMNKYLSLSSGAPSNNIHKMLDSSLSVAIVTGMSKLKKGHPEVYYENIRVYDQNRESDYRVNLTLRPLSKKSARFEHYVLVLIQDVEPKPATPEFYGDLVTSVNQHIVDLERELELYQEKLQVTVEELETANEELQATNEELVSANEELQSTNEELHSVNEELTTVNAEYQSNIQELKDLNNDMDNFLESTRIGTVFLDPEMRVRRYTPAITKEINLMEVDIGRPIGHITHQLKYNSLLEDTKRVLKTGFTVEREIESQTGKWYSLRILPYRTEDTVIRGTVLTLVDITHIKVMNAELVKLSYAIEQSPSIVVITDAQGKIEYVNPKFVESTGFQPEDVVGQSLRDLNHWRDDSDSYSELWNQISKYQKWSGELECKRKDGLSFWETVSIVPILNNKNQIIHYLKVAEDVTEIKETEELLRKSEMLSAVGELAAGIAHEIRNPLTALKGFTKLIQSNSKSSTYLDIMQKELERIEVIINELLILSKPQVVKFERVNVLSVMNDVIMLLNTQALMNRVDIEFQCEEDALQLVGIENQLKQVFINMLKNSIEAMPNGGTITVRAECRMQQEAIIEVIDQGEGIPEDKLVKLGQPFYTTKDKGTGLGLMVSYKIIEQHGGKIEYTSQLKVGTTARVILPVKALEDMMKGAKA